MLKFGRAGYTWFPKSCDGKVKSVGTVELVESSNHEMPNGETTFHRSKKPVYAHINRRCAACAARVRITVYEDGTYRGGEYFGKMPELAMRKRPGGYDAAVADEIWRHSDEYWECINCTRR